MIQGMIQTDDDPELEIEALGGAPTIGESI
jgi:hypothetical protein